MKNFLYTSDKIKLAVNHYQTGYDSVVILAHGWFMTKDSKAFLKCEMFSEYFDVISFDFRGYGKARVLCI
ncbi:MAG: alpha/beta fold hydrolase [Candidatus Gastranaerophilaceae bacterium]